MIRRIVGKTQIIVDQYHFEKGGILGSPFHAAVYSAAEIIMFAATLILRFIIGLDTDYTKVPIIKSFNLYPILFRRYLHLHKPRSPLKYPSP